MAELPKFLEGGAFGILNDVLAGYHSNEGYATPNRFEVLVHGPQNLGGGNLENVYACLLYTSPSPRDRTRSRMPSSA